MDQETGLPHQIEVLVDHLRANKDTSYSLADIASVTEVLIGSMRTFFSQVDTQIYRECRAMSEYITNARGEIASLQPKDLESSRIPRAGLELDAIVSQTESATNTIMESAEAIMGADPSDQEAYQQCVQDNVMAIFEACSFQDITGQRISKVVETLSYVEGRVMQLRDLLGVSEEDCDPADSPEDTREGDARLLNGPALEGEGIAQTDVDALLDTPPAPVPSEEPDADTDTAVNGHDDPPEAEEEAAPKPAQSTNQDDIDALFG